MKKLIYTIAFIVVCSVNLSAQNDFLEADSLIIYGGGVFDNEVQGAEATQSNSFITLNQLNSAFAALDLTEFTDPAINEATSTAVIDTAQGTLVTLTSAGNDQFLQQPTEKTRRKFTVINDSQSAGNINVNGYILEPGSFNTFIYDSVQWVGDNILSQFSLNTGGTGLRDGGKLSGIGSSTFDLSAGIGFIIDNTTNAGKPDITNVAWDDFLNVTITNLATSTLSYIAINANGGIIQQTIPFSPAQHRKLIVIGRLAHITNTVITSLTPTPRLGTNQTLEVSDLAAALGTVTNGNIYNGIPTTLTIEKSSGSTFREGLNYYNDTLQPNTSIDAILSPALIVYGWRDGSGGLTFSAPTTIVDPEHYDDGSGTLALVGSNDFSNQRAYFFAVNNLTFILYGQNTYNTFNEARTNALSESFDVPAELEALAALRNVIVMRENIITWTDPITDDATYKFIPLGKLGEATVSGGGASTASTLQQAYNISTQPQIITNGALDALQIQGGSGIDSETTQQWLNNTGGVTASVTGDGTLTIDSLSVLEGAIIGNSLDVGDEGTFGGSITTTLNSASSGVSIGSTRGFLKIGVNEIVDDGANMKFNAVRPALFTNDLNVTGLVTGIGIESTAAGASFRVSGVGTNVASTRYTNDGGQFFTGIENSTGSFFGANPYEAVLYSPSDNLHVRTPRTDFTGTVNVEGSFISVGAATFTSLVTFSTTAPSLRFNETDRVDENWNIITSGGNFTLHTASSDFAILSTKLSVDQSGDFDFQAGDLTTTGKGTGGVDATSGFDWVTFNQLTNGTFIADFSELDVGDIQANVYRVGGVSTTIRLDGSNNMEFNDAFNTDVTLSELAAAIGINDLTDAIYDGSSIFLGEFSGSLDDGSNNNVAVGKNAMADNVSGTRNSAVGYMALGKGGTDNVGVGFNALELNTGVRNVGIGSGTMDKNTTGFENVGIGHSALEENTIGDRNIGIGYQAGNNLTTGNKNIIIGYDIDVQSPTSDNQLSIGNLIFGTGGFGTNATVGTGFIGIRTTTPGFELDVNGDSNSDNYPAVSDRRIKDNIKKVSGLIRSYNYSRKKAKRKGFEINYREGKRYGVIAQDVEKIEPSLVSETSRGIKKVDNISMLYKLIADQQKQIEELKSQVAKLNE